MSAHTKVYRVSATQRRSFRSILMIEGLWFEELKSTDDSVFIVRAADPVHTLLKQVLHQYDVLYQTIYVPRSKVESALSEISELSLSYFVVKQGVFRRKLKVEGTPEQIQGLKYFIRHFAKKAELPAHHRFISLRRS